MNTQMVTHMNGQSNVPRYEEYYVWQDNGRHIGPVTPETVAKGIIAGHVDSGALIGLAGGSIWAPAGNTESVKQQLQRLSSIPPAMPVVTTKPSAQVSPPSSAMPSTKPAPSSVAPPVPQPATAKPATPATPVAPPAPAPVEAAKPAVAAVAAPAAKTEPAKPPALDPKYKMLPLVIFGACGALGSVMTVIKLIAG